MNTPARQRWNVLPSALAAIAAIFMVSPAARAANTVLFWDADGAASAFTGGLGTWDTTSSLWRLTTSTGTLQTYTNTAPSTITATLGGSTPAYLTLAPSTTINVNTIDFGGTLWLGYQASGSSGSVLNGAAGSKIVLSAGAGATNATPTLMSNAVQGASNHTINAILDGVSGLNKSNDVGTLVFNGANTSPARPRFSGETSFTGTRRRLAPIARSPWHRGPRRWCRAALRAAPRR